MQAFNDFLIFGGMAISSFSSGQLLEYFGWVAINEVIFPTILAVGAMLVWLSLRKRAAASCLTTALIIAPLIPAHQHRVYPMLATKHAQIG